MSTFSRASAAHGISPAFTSLHCIGGIDIDCSQVINGMYTQRIPDIKAEGGAIFGGSVAVFGDMCIAGTLSGNVGGNLSGNLMGDISVEGDLDVGGNLTAMDGLIANLETDVLCVNDELFVDMISPKTGNVIDLGNVIVDDITINGTLSGNINIDLSNVSMLTLETVTSNLVDANIICVNDQLQVDNIIAKTGNTLFFDSNISTIAITSNVGCFDVLKANILSSNDSSGNVLLSGNIIPSQDQIYSLGNLTNKFNEIFVNDLTVCGSLLGNVDIGMGNVSNLSVDILTSNVGCFDVLKGNVLSSNGPSGNILLSGNIIPSQDQIFSLGNITNKFDEIFVNDLTVCGSLLGNVNIDIGNVSNLTVDTITSNVGCFDILKGNVLSSNGPSGNILLSGNIIPFQDQIFSLGNVTNKFDEIFVNDLTVCGSLLGNVNIDVGNVSNLSVDIFTANTVCVNTEILADVINEKTANAGVTVDGVFHHDSNVTTEILTANIINAPFLSDYTRTVVSGNVYSILQSDDIIAVKGTANGIVTLTLPLIGSMFRKRKRFAIVDEAGHAGANSIVITTTGSDKIFAGTSWMLSGDFNAVQIYSDEMNNWFAI